MTQMASAKKCEITPEMRAVSEKEGLNPETLRRLIAEGTAIIPKNRCHSINPIGIGRNLSTKVNANIGTSGDCKSIDFELEKARTAVKAGADTLMDLSTGGDLNRIREKIMEAAPICFGTNPIYQAGIEVLRKGKTLGAMTVEGIFSVIDRHGTDGVDFITVHCGVTRDTVARMRKEGRTLDVVSRGGAFLIAWMDENGRENPLYEHYGDLLEIAFRHDMTLSLGDGLRPGCLADATDRAQVQETIFLGELAQRAWERGVQVMIEGPGHVPLNQIEANILLQKRLCHGAPFYVLGPLVTDIAPGYDHITSAIGGAVAAAAGADFLCYVTPSEHLRLPTPEDVWEGVMAARIAAHAADVVKGVGKAEEWDRRMSEFRKKQDWEGQARCALDPERVLRLRMDAPPRDKSVCTMCGDLCAIKIMKGKRSLPEV